MKMHALALTAALALGGMALGHYALAADAPATQPAGKPINTKCPITGDAIDLKGPTVVYEGKTIGFCCDDCPAKFKADPAKYMKDLK